MKPARCFRGTLGKCGKFIGFQRIFCKPNSISIPKITILFWGFQPSPNGSCLWHWFSRIMEIWWNMCFAWRLVMFGPFPQDRHANYVHKSTLVYRWRMVQFHFWLCFSLCVSAHSKLRTRNRGISTTKPSLAQWSTNLPSFLWSELFVMEWTAHADFLQMSSHEKWLKAAGLLRASLKVMPPACTPCGRLAAWLYAFHSQDLSGDMGHWCSNNILPRVLYVEIVILI